MNSSAPYDAFRVSLGMHLLSGFVTRLPRLWIGLGNLESATLCKELGAIPIDRPIYVTGLARAGTTILLELLSRHPQVGTHKYRDFPGLFVPTWWNRGSDRCATAPRARAHGDRIEVTPDSPEAMEECLWAAFFRDAHQPATSDVLDATTTHGSFERFYRDHIRKVLHTRCRSRYAAKGNYNFTRVEYLHAILPTARFIVAIRHPRDHIASLMRQHQLFCAGERAHPRALAHMQRVGHFEFGLDRRPISLGDGVAQEVMALWRQGQETRGCARYWASLYGWLLDTLSNNDALNRVTRVVCYESLCAAPVDMTEAIASHCDLSLATPMRKYADRIESPPLARHALTQEDAAIIEEETGSVAHRWQSAFTEISWDLRPQTTLANAP